MKAFERLVFSLRVAFNACLVVSTLLTLTLHYLAVCLYIVDLNYQTNIYKLNFTNSTINLSNKHLNSCDIMKY